jgi:disulfide bond formation protein DsbB
VTSSLDNGRAAALLAGLIALAVIVAALVLEHGFGYAPCPLCLQQRWPYYIGVPCALVLAGLAGRLPPRLTGVLLVALAGLFVWGMATGIYQAGAEWGYWMGPRDCSAGNSVTNPDDVSGLLDAIKTSTVVSCTNPRLRIFGVSLAGWNAVVMAGLIAISLAGAWRAVFKSR